ncbi:MULTISPECIES: GNAT family N-acetyltransferase [unclassified Halomonas]|uniref:GNAT family N-acetyltransferase n=1 Tax=unclassified Halomonas TaxID=2609666 RepID=UPI000990973D|nr:MULTISPECIES: GNAT family N-acetyltransferase [unclassified Halomonas]AQU82740.1 GNAT family N-acetyltransferase [Halomonas sp. 'Soap Lake \
MQICETERLVIRALSLNDVSELNKILSDPEVMKYSIRGVCDEAATRRFIDWCLDCYASRSIGPWALVEKVSGQLIGFCGISPEEVNGVEEIGLGYRLAKQYWNKGFASEAVQAVLSSAFSQKQLSSVVVIIESENVASLKVANKAGFSAFETLEFHSRPVRLYRLTPQQWSASQNNAANTASV